MMKAERSERGRFYAKMRWEKVYHDREASSIMASFMAGNFNEEPGERTDPVIDGARAGVEPRDANHEF